MIQTLTAAWATLRAADPWSVVQAVIAYALGALSIGLRLRIAARGIAPQLSSLRATAIGLASTFASHLSFGATAGELSRITALSRELPAGTSRAPRALLAIALDRIADGAAIAGMLTIGLALGASGAKLWLAIAPLVVAIVLLFGMRRYRNELSLRRLLTDVLMALPAACAAWLFDVIRLHLVGRAVGIWLGPGALTALAIAALVGGQAPTPGGLGAVEAAMFAAGLVAGVPAAPLLAVIALDRALTLTLGTLLGGVSLVAVLRAPQKAIAT